MTPGMKVQARQEDVAAIHYALALREVMIAARVAVWRAQEAHGEAMAIVEALYPELRGWQWLWDESSETFILMAREDQPRTAALAGEDQP